MIYSLYEELKTQIKQCEMDRTQNAETVSYWHDHESEFAMEQINSGKKSLGYYDTIFSEREIGKATEQTSLYEIKEAQSVCSSDMREVEHEKKSSKKESRSKS